MQGYLSEASRVYQRVWILKSEVHEKVALLKCPSLKHLEQPQLTTYGCIIYNTLCTTCNVHV